MSPFFALYVTHARKAQRELHEAGFETWAPTYKRLVVRRREKLLEDTPLLSGYVFARIAPRFSDAIACEHVAYVVSSSGVPRAIPDDLIEPLRELVACGRLDERLPGTKARPRKVRRKGLDGLMAWFEVAERSVKEAA